MQRKICVREIDKLGRIVLPQEARSAVGLKGKQSLDVYIDGDNIILKPNTEIPACCLCGETGVSLKKIDKFLLCKDCMDDIKAASFE